MPRATQHRRTLRRYASWLARYPLPALALAVAIFLALTLWYQASWSRPPSWFVFATAGGLAVSHGDHLLPAARPSFEIERYRPGLPGRLTGFCLLPKFWRTITGWNGPSQTLIIPLWIPLAFCTALAAIVWRRHLTRRLRLRAGVCPTCAYDLRGLPASAPCPECGHTKPTARPAPSEPP